MYQRDLRGDVGEIQCLLDRGIAAADDGDLLIAIEEAVAGGAGRDTLAHEGFLGSQAEILGSGTGRDDQRVAGVFAGIADQLERRFVELCGVDVVENDLGFEALRVLQEARHQVRPHDAVGVGGPVVHLGRGHQLPPLGDAGDQHRI